MLRAMSGVESPLATRAAILISVGVRASQPDAARPASAPDAAPDAVGAKPAVGSPDVPPGFHVLVQGYGLVHDGSPSSSWPRFASTTARSSRAAGNSTAGPGER